MDLFVGRSANWSTQAEDRKMKDPELNDPWLTSEHDFPESASLPERLKYLVGFAILAPSGHNTQPWLFAIGAQGVALLADRSRALAVVDPEDRELIMSCGAALFHLTVAMRHYRMEPRVTLFPDESDLDLLARVEVAGVYDPTLEEERLFMAIKKRHTNRSPFLDQPVPDLELDSLRAAAESSGSRLDLFSDDNSKSALASLIATGDRIQAGNKHFRRELAAWLRPNRSYRSDGIPGYAMGAGDVKSRLGPFVVRTFDWGDGQAARDEQLAAGSPVIAVLSTDRDDRRSWLQAGMALDHVLLLAADYGIQASYLNQPIEVAELRRELGSMVGESHYPQIVLRMGYGNEDRRTPRRPASHVVVRE